MPVREPRFVPLGEFAWRAERPAGAPARAIEASLAAVPGVREVVLTERFVVAHTTEHGAAGRGALERALRASAGAHAADGVETAREHAIEVRYDGEDLDAVAERVGLSREGLVALHTAGVYEVRFVGFSPGFAYLGPVDPRLALPRRETPRARVPANSVAIAGGYTAVYPRAGSGGWHLLGTAVGFSAFDEATGSALRTGDRVRFVPARDTR